jgi:hypothetical protein
MNFVAFHFRTSKMDSYTFRKLLTSPTEKGCSQLNLKKGVLPHLVVDNSDFSTNRLTALETLLILKKQGSHHSLHIKQRGLVWHFISSYSYSWSASSSSLWRCFGVLTGSIFSLSTHEEGPSTSELTGSSNRALDCPACRLTSTLSSGVESAPPSVRPWFEMKSRRGAPKRVNTEGFACPNQ